MRIECQVNHSGGPTGSDQDSPFASGRARYDRAGTDPRAVERTVHVVVVGCGRVGSELAGTLEKQGHTVAVIDKRKDAFRRLPTGFGGYRIVGFGFDRDTLEEAGDQAMPVPSPR